MTEKCKRCGGTGWHSGDLKSDQAHSMLISMGIDFEVVCTECEAGRAELKKAEAEAKQQP